MLSIGQLDRRIVVQSPTDTRDDYGGKQKSLELFTIYGLMQTGSQVIEKKNLKSKFKELI